MQAQRDGSWPSPSLWRNKAVELNKANSEDFVKIHLIAMQAHY